MRDKEKMNEENRKRYWYYKEHGICTKCGQRDAMYGFSLCEECSYKMIMQKQEYQKNLTKERRDRINQLSRERKARFREKGLCSACGRKVNDTRYKLCLECRLAARRYHKKAREDKRIWWKETGVCRYCGSKDVVEGKCLCAKCLERQQKIARHALEKAREKIDRSYWKMMNNAFWKERQSNKKQETH